MGKGMKQVIQTSQAPAAIGCYSQAIRSGNTVYLSGQIPLNPNSMTVVEGDIVAQITQVFENLKHVATAAGGSLDAIVKLTVFLTDISYLADVNAVMPNYFKEPYPARTSIAVAGLPKAVDVEVEAIMVI
jgi:reactive intermediate/imine deaminase